MQKKSILSLAIMAMLIVGLTLTGCGKSHKYNENWSSDAENHWHACEDKNCDKKKDVATHTFNEGVITVEPGIGTKGVKTYTCSVCNYQKTEEIPAIDHTHVAGSTWEKDATNHWNLCECGEKMNVAAHTFNEGVVTVEPGIGTKGVKTYTCSVCNYQKTEEIPAIDHTHVAGSTWEKDATNHWNLCECGEKMNVAVHISSDWIVDNEPDYGVKGNSHKECTVCGFVLEEKETDALPAKDVTITYDVELDKTYDGTPVAFNIVDVVVSNGATPVAEWYKVDGESNATKIENVPVDAGTYKLLLKTLGTAEWKEATLSVDVLIFTKFGEIKVTKDLNKVYDGEAVSLSDSDITGNSDDLSYTITWYNYTTDHPDYVLAEAPKDAGNYTVKVEMAETNNVSKASFVVNFDISRRTLYYGQAYAYGNPNYLKPNLTWEIGDTYSNNGVKYTNKVEGDYVAINFCFDNIYVGSNLSVFKIDEAACIAHNSKAHLNYVLDTEVKPVIVPKKLTNLNLVTEYNGEKGRTDFVLTAADGIFEDDDVRVVISGNALSWDALTELTLSLTDNIVGDEAISFVEEGEYANYVLTLTGDYVGTLTINQKVLTNLDLQTYYDETAGRTNFALSAADGIVAGEAVYVDISGYNSGEWGEGDSYILRLNPGVQGEETITLVENENSSNYILVEKDGSVGTITINHSVILKNITFKASQGIYSNRFGFKTWIFSLTNEMGLEAGDSVTISVKVFDDSGKISLTKENTSFNNKKYFIGSGCYLDLDN